MNNDIKKAGAGVGASAPVFFYDFFLVDFLGAELHRYLHPDGV